MKTCNGCGETKPIETGFYKRASSKDGYHNRCKSCRIKNATDWIASNRDRYNARIRADRKINPEKYAQWFKAYSTSNPERYAQIKRTWVEANGDKRSEISSRYSKSHRAEGLALVRARQARKLRATPHWADDELMTDFYRLAKIWSEATGDKYEVDHIVPLRSRYVCGLHCQANLQILPRRDNRRKGNKHWPDMPL